ncbi:MAG TPA: response regulator [Candidatus Omnitrophota bacterium]|nr:response regulator [Candidatus Omnitrophota bacterium]
MNDTQSVRKKILIIDDEGDIAKLTAKRLELTGYSVLTLENGSKAIETAKNKRPDLILLDIVMPGRNGCEICKDLKSNEDTRGIPVILFSAHYPEKEFIGKNYSDFGADDCISKPYDDEVLIEKIKRLIK